jgi:hypothetical protein
VYVIAGTGPSGSGQACGLVADRGPVQVPCWPPGPRSGPAAEAVVGVAAAVTAVVGEGGAATMTAVAAVMQEEAVAVVAVVEVAGERFLHWQLLLSPPPAACAAVARQVTLGGSSPGASYCDCAGQRVGQVWSVSGRVSLEAAPGGALTCVAHQPLPLGPLQAVVPVVHVVARLNAARQI